MAIISTRSRYGLRLLVDLAEQGSSGPVDLHSIAERQGIPEKYLAKLVMTLRAAGFVRSVRGAGGGYILERAPENIDLLSVVEVLEGQSSLLECTAKPEACPRSANCGSRDLWAGLEKAIADYLGSRSIASVARVDSSTAPEYYI